MHTCTFSELHSLLKRRLNIHIKLQFSCLFIVHIRKRNNLVNGSIITANYNSQNETMNKQIDVYRSLDTTNENKFVRPYFLIRPQSVLMLPNETGKFVRTNLLLKLKQT